VICEQAGWEEGLVLGVLGLPTGLRPEGCMRCIREGASLLLGGLQDLAVQLLAVCLVFVGVQAVDMPDVCNVKGGDEIMPVVVRSVVVEGQPKAEISPDCLLHPLATVQAP
jgi:hypothetical protein